MAAGSEFPSMGATIFFGLTAATLITQGPAPEELANPLDGLQQSGFEQDRHAVAFAGFMAWSAPLQIPDRPLDGRVLAGEVPSVRATVTAFAQGEDVRTPVKVQSDAVAEPRAPSLQTAQLQISASMPHTKVRKPSMRPLDQDRNIIALSDRVYSKPKVTGLAPLFPAEIRASDTKFDPELRRVDRPANTVAAFAPIVRGRTLPSPRVSLPSRVTGKGVFLRASPDLTARVLMQFDRGDQGTVLEIEGDWRLVEFPGLTGWMFGAFLAPRVD